MKPEYDFSKAKREAVTPQKGKTRISIYIDDAILAKFRARAEKAGKGYQTMMNEAPRVMIEAGQSIRRRGRTAGGQAAKTPLSPRRRNA